MLDLTMARFEVADDPTGGGVPFVRAVYPGDNGDVSLGFGLQNHGGQIMGVRYNASPSDQRDILVLAPDERLEIQNV